MAKVVVGTSPVAVPVDGRARPVIQNLGPGDLYIEDASSVSAGTGLKIVVGAVFEFYSAVAADGQVWMVASAANTDVRVLGLGG